MGYFNNRIRNAVKKTTKLFYFSDDQLMDLSKNDWDNLILLDGCRFDAFEKNCTNINGKLQARISLGSSTPEFIRRNFKNKNYLDTVYITANPQYLKWDAQDSFYHSVDVWDEAWSSKHETVLPESVTEYAKNAADEYPNKKLIIHYMQPHYPFIGELGKKIDKQDSFGKKWRSKENKNNSSQQTVWEMLKKNQLSYKETWEAYVENLQIALPHVSHLSKYLNGKTVITSDHGNLFGKKVFPLRKKLYGHPSYIYDDGLRKVPWFEIPYDERKKTTQSNSVYKESIKDDIVTDRLESLGYK